MASGYELKITRLAQKELGSLEENTYRRIKQAIVSLAETPRPVGCKKLANRDAWRVRMGDYRVIYEIHDRELVVIVIRVVHRKEAYR